VYNVGKILLKNGCSNHDERKGLEKILYSKVASLGLVVTPLSDNLGTSAPVDVGSPEAGRVGNKTSQKNTIKITGHGQHWQPFTFYSGCTSCSVKLHT
jgi:hypothetical protein